VLMISLVLYASSALTFCASSAQAAGDWIPITESQDVTDPAPEWSEACAAELEAIFKDNEEVDLDDNLSTRGEAMARQVLGARSCQSLGDSSVAFCRFSRKSVRRGCRVALKDFRKVLKTVTEETLGCGFSSKAGKGFAFVCVKNSNNPGMVLKQTVSDMCRGLISVLYNKHNIRRDPELEQLAQSASNSALDAETCKHSSANRCKVIKNLMSTTAARSCFVTLNGINPQIPKLVGCNYIQRGNAALTCIIKRP